MWSGLGNVLKILGDFNASTLYQLMYLLVSGSHNSSLQVSFNNLLPQQYQNLVLIVIQLVNN